MTRNGEVEDTGVSAAVLGHPANAVAALARHLAKYGQCLLPGDVILSGAFSGMVEIRAGDVIWADYGPVGEIRLALG